MLADEQVMHKVKDGKVEMLAVLFERYQVRLFNFFLRLTGDRGSSEDMVQDVFFRILKYRRSYRRDCKFTTWMYQIARNVNIDNLKKYQNEVPLDEQWEEDTAPTLAPEEQISVEQDRLFLNKALTTLALKKREVLVLSRFQDMKYKEIAQLLGCSIDNVKVLVHRGIKDLRESYLNLKGGTAWAVKK